MEQNCKIGNIYNIENLEIPVSKVRLNTLLAGKRLACQSNQTKQKLVALIRVYKKANKI